VVVGKGKEKRDDFCLPFLNNFQCKHLSCSLTFAPPPSTFLTLFQAMGVEDKLHRHPHHYDHDPEAAHDTNSRSSTAGAPPPNHPNQPTVTNTAAITVAAASSSNLMSWFKASGSKEKEKGDDAATQLLITETAAAHH
jgi:hypothetical protein